MNHASESAPKKVTLMTDSLVGNRLLIVDDEPELGSLIKKVAVSAGFEVS